MADDYWSWTIPFSEAEIPIDLATTDGHELPHSISEAMGKPSVLLTMSRSDWLNGALVNTYSAFGGTALAFLVKDPKSLPGDRSVASSPVGVGKLRFQQRWLITALAHAGIPDALAEIESWLATATRHPERFIAPMWLHPGDEELITEEARNAADLTEEGAGVEGDRPMYFFSFLKGLRTVLLDAHARRLAVLHVRYVYLFSRDP
jgi:hypothetical protein